MARPRCLLSSSESAQRRSASFAASVELDSGRTSCLRQGTSLRALAGPADGPSLRGRVVCEQLDELRRIPEVERLVLIPCTDLWAQAVADVAGDSQAFFATSAPTSAVVEQLDDKLHFACRSVCGVTRFRSVAPAACA
jgi:hypothetical protein